MKYQINRFNSVGVHFSYHRSLSDYLDDVGPDEYPDLTKLYNKLNTGTGGTEKAGAAVYFAKPGSKTSSPGQVRASPNNPSDKYINFGIFYSRRLFK